MNKCKNKNLFKLIPKENCIQFFQSRIVSDFSLCFVVLLVFLWLSGRALR